MRRNDLSQAEPRTTLTKMSVAIPQAVNFVPGNFQLRSAAGRGEIDAPEVLHRGGFEKLDSIRIDFVKCTDQCHDAGRSLNPATVVLYYNGGTDKKLTIQLDDSSISVEVGCFGGHREGAFLTIVA